MIRKLAVVLIFWMSFSSLFGQYLTDFPTTSNALLWKIEGKDVKKDAYIFGTIHLIDKDKFYFPASLQKIINSSKQVVLEIAQLDQAEVFNHIFLKKGTVLEYFNPEQQDSLLQWAHTQLQVDSAQFMLSYLKMKPFVLVQLATQKELVDKTKSYDMTIQQMANEQKISTVGLETVAEQMAIFDNMDTLTQRNMVMELVRHPERQMKQLEKMYAIYLQQNVDAMFQFIDEDKSSMMDAQNELLDNRNQKWIPKIETLIKSKRTFIAVGAGHLGGKNGVLRLLEKKGYKLTPIHL